MSEDEEFFQCRGNDNIRVYGDYLSDLISVDQLYQMFKARMLREEEGRKDAAQPKNAASNPSWMFDAARQQSPNTPPKTPGKT